MSTFAALYFTKGQVDRKGFSDGLNGSHRFFDLGFDSRYDVAYRAGTRVRFAKRPVAIGDNGVELQPGNGDIQ